MQLYSLIINWHDRDAEQGTYGATVYADSPEEAEATVRAKMCQSLAEERGCDVDDVDVEFGSVVDCGTGAYWAADRMEKALAALLEWETHMGGYDAPCWREARQVMGYIRDIRQGDEA